MKEKDIFNKIEAEIKAVGGISWAVHAGPGRARFTEKTDIFGIFDMIYINHTGGVGFIQATTAGHETQRRSKIYNFFTDTRIEMPPNCWLYSWDKVKDGMIKERLS